MSEYQYYEFRAIDRPLDEPAMTALRAMSTRAEITPTSLVNVYHFGNFKGNPDRLMDQYFDAFVYVANWGTHRFMVRLPSRIFEPATIQPYLVTDVFRSRIVKEHVVLDFRSEEEGGSWEEGEERMASLVPLRADLMAGDLRCLYLAWLAGVEAGAVAMDKPEPVVPPGLQTLSVPLSRFADFLRLEPELIKAAALRSGEDVASGPPAEQLADWVALLPQIAKDQLLVQLIRGEDIHLAGELLQRFRKDTEKLLVRTGRQDESSSAPRTAGDLIAARDRIADEDRRVAAEQAEKERASRARKQAAARARHLDSLAGREDELWRLVETAIDTKKPKEYDRATELLKDLKDLAELAGKVESVATRIRQLRERHRTKRTLIQRLDRAGFP